jgi:hypothetical protein
MSAGKPDQRPAIIDSQSLKSAEKGEVTTGGYDAKGEGPQDPRSLPMRVVVHSAAALVLVKIRIRFPWLELVCADSGYHAGQVDAADAIVPLCALRSSNAAMP